MAGRSTAGRVAVTPRSLSAHGHPALQLLTEAGLEVVFPAPGRTPTRQEQLAVLPDCVAYLAGVEPIDAGLIAACPRLKVIARNGVGVSNIDLDAARDAGIEVVAAPGANAQGVAELAVGLMFAAARHLPYSDAQLKSGRWERQEGAELDGRRLGVVGMGQIGRRVARIGLGIGMRVAGYDLRRDPALELPASFRWDDLDTLLSESDVISLHVPPGPIPLLGHREFAAMRRGAVVINTARAELVDETAALAALESGQLAAYAVDAFIREPPEDLRLVRHPNVIATPHIGGYTDASVERATRAAVHAILDRVPLGVTA